MQHAMSAAPQDWNGQLPGSTEPALARHPILEKQAYRAYILRLVWSEAHFAVLVINEDVIE